MMIILTYVWGHLEEGTCSGPLFMKASHLWWRHMRTSHHLPGFAWARMQNKSQKWAKPLPKPHSHMLGKLESSQLHGDLGMKKH